MLEEKPCLWDVFDKEYTKRDVKEIAYTEIASSLDTSIESIKLSKQKLMGSELTWKGSSKGQQNQEWTEYR